MYIATYALPAGLDREIKRRHPTVGQLVPEYRALRQWLRLNVVSMDVLATPSLAVDLLWREFTLNTDSYDQFCRKAYGNKLPIRCGLPAPLT
jgi:hypothetical protein